MMDAMHTTESGADAAMAHIGQKLENPASGERITFCATAAETNGELVAIDLELPAGRRGPGPPPVHPQPEEGLAGLAGTMRFRGGRNTVVPRGRGGVAVPPPRR